MARLLDESPLFPRAVVSVVKEGSNTNCGINVESCQRHGVTMASLHRFKSAASCLDAALKGLYSGNEMPPDSQLEPNSPDSQLEAVSQDSRHVGGVECGEVRRSGVECGGVERGAHMHSTHVSDNVGGTDTAFASAVPTFPDTTGKPDDVLLYGYYLPHRNLMVGHRGHALSARFVWTRKFRDIVPQPLDGVAVWTLRGGQNVVRVVVRDFFTGKYTVLDRLPKVGIVSGT